MTSFKENLPKKYYTLTKQDISGCGIKITPEPFY